MTSIYYSFFIDKVIFIIILVLIIVLYKKDIVPSLIFFLVSLFFSFLLISSFLGPSLSSSLEINKSLTYAKPNDVKLIQLVQKDVLIKEFNNLNEIHLILSKVKNNRIFSANHGSISEEYYLDFFFKEGTVTFRILDAKAGTILYLQNYKGDKSYDVAVYKNNNLGSFLKKYLSN